MMQYILYAYRHYENGILWLKIHCLSKAVTDAFGPPDKDKSAEDRQREEQLLLQIHKLVETRDYLVEDVEFERLRWALNKAQSHFYPLPLTPYPYPSPLFWRGKGKG